MAPPHTGEVPSQEAELPSSLTRALSRTSIDNSTDGGPCGAHIGELASKAPRVTVLQEEDAAANLDQLEADTIEGLSKAVKRLSSLYFYDDKGSQLFRDITDQKEYYLTAAEAEILATHGRAILAAAGVGATSGPVNVIELGAGDGCKTVSLLGHLTASGADYEYAPIDISREAMRLLFSMLARSKAGAGVRVHGIVGDYLHALDFVVSGPPSSLLPSTSGSLEGTSVNGSQASSDDAQKVDGANDDVAGSGNTATAGVSTPPKNLVVFLGSSLGNFDPATALAFLRDIRARLRSGDCLLIGYDLKKSPATLLPAYSDAAGVTAAFNYNLLDRLNRDVGGDFDARTFEHHAVYNPVAGTMESYLLSTRRQVVHVGRGARRTEFTLNAWEPIHTEYSHKYTEAQMGGLADIAGFSVVCNFTDAEGRYVDAVWSVA
eukprot:TRINITY_DN1332_c0_g1_i7.p1 TRINITY_DN1332_c0_g1~~TRINITY_DN1332_c0_g1_i7.p1  ORF type:complete len:478 (-),score=164.39 TRINITY_DN1332_c0_g1_i7:279-1580(-)